MGLLNRGIDDLNEPDRVAIDLGDEEFSPVDIARQFALPVVWFIRTACRRDMSFRIPIAKERKIRQICLSQPHRLFHGPGERSGRGFEASRAATSQASCRLSSGKP